MDQNIKNTVMSLGLIAIAVIVIAVIFSAIISVSDTAERPVQPCAKFHKNGFADSCLNERIFPLPPDDLKIGAVKADITGNWRSCWLDECKSDDSIVYLTINNDGTYLVKSWNQPKRGKWYEEWVAEWIVYENKWKTMNVIIFQPEDNSECPWRLKIKNKELILIMYDRNMNLKNLMDDDSIKYERYK